MTKASKNLEKNIIKMAFIKIAANRRTSNCHFKVKKMFWKKIKLVVAPEK